jgi:hypothetical protein
MRRARASRKARSARPSRLVGSCATACTDPDRSARGRVSPDRGSRGADRHGGRSSPECGPALRLTGASVIPTHELRPGVRFMRMDDRWSGHETPPSGPRCRSTAMPINDQRCHDPVALRGRAWCRRRDSNPHALRPPGLSRLRLPFRHSGRRWRAQPTAPGRPRRRTGAAAWLGTKHHAGRAVRAGPPLSDVWEGGDVDVFRDRLHRWRPSTIRTASSWSKAVTPQTGGPGFHVESPVGGDRDRTQTRTGSARGCRRLIANQR